MTGTRLETLRSQLTGLRHARASARWMSALAALGVALLWSLVALFAIDCIFQREVQSPQRLILLLLAAGAVYWSFRRFGQPLLAVRESDVDMALMVERQQQIDSDLVAAIQFEDDVHGRWGSRQLETAVINYVAQLGPDIDVYQGFDRRQLSRRGIILGVTAAVILVAALLYPGYLMAFANRLAMGTAHYPSATQIELLAINGRNVLPHGMKPQNIRCAEGRQVEFVVRGSGRPAEIGLLRLSSKSRSQHTETELKPLTAEERVARLRTAQQMIVEAKQTPGIDLAGPWYERLASLVRYELPSEWNTWNADLEKLPAGELGTQLPTKLPELETVLIDRVAKHAQPGAPAEAATVLYVGEVPRLNDDITYRITLGDAYTDPAEIGMIALPAVEAKLTAVPPKYAARALANETANRQAAVLVGSEVKVAIECTNKKQLQQAWITVRGAADLRGRRYDLKSAGGEGTQWALVGETPFASVHEELRYEIQVTDEDGLHLETPIKGSVRIRTDKPPVAIASTVHRVVLPTAKPSIQYRAGDDFGLKRLQLVVQVERQVDQQQKLLTSTQTGEPVEASTQPTQSVDDGGQEVKLETTSINLLASGSPVGLDRLPLAGKAPIPLASLQLEPSRGPLAKGDRLKVVLVAEDDRGTAKSETFRSEPIIIEVSDEFGVASAVGESDPQAEQRVSEIIKRQLGIGESP